MGRTMEARSRSADGKGGEGASPENSEILHVKCVHFGAL